MKRVVLRLTDSEARPLHRQHGGLDLNHVGFYICVNRSFSKNE